MFNLSNIYTQVIGSESKIYGVTLDAVDHLNDITESLSRLSKKPTTRIVFDESAPASQYVQTVDQIHNVSYIIGCIVDSYYMEDYTLDQYINRLNDYVNTLSNNVDIWEVGNEVNGEWLGSVDTVIMKITQGYSVLKNQNKKIALTLFYNENCWEKSENEMFYWINNSLPDSLKSGLDYVLVSYYEDDCNNFQPDWQRVFDSLHVIFPHSKLGIGECGTTKSSLKTSYMKRYYNMKIKTTGYIGGYFWWYFREDCVPYTKSLWKVLNGLFSLTN
jgi:hypothetical protein